MEIVEQHQGGLVGVDHIAHLGDASASLGLISTLVFSLAISCLLDMELTGDWPNSVVAGFLIVACATSAFVMSFALLEYYYAQMLKSRDEELKIDGLEEERQRLRFTADKGMQAVNGLRASSRNCMWGSLILLLFSGVAHVLEEEHGTYLFIFAVLVLGAATVLVIFNVAAFRNEFKEATWRSVVEPVLASHERVLS